MEKAEVAIVGAQFAALAVLILILGNYAGVNVLGPSTTQVGTVYWGAPSAGVTLAKGAVNTEKTNASSIFAYFTLPKSTEVTSVSATRLCLIPSNNTGDSTIYSQITISYDNQKHQNYVTFGPTGQPLGIGCTYTITIVDTLQQTVTWTGTVKLVS